MVRIQHAFCDLDDTHLHFMAGHRPAIAFLAKEVGQKFANAFDATYQVLHLGGQAQDGDWSMVPGGQEAYEQLRKKLQLTKIGSRSFPWSRELAALHAAQVVDMQLHPREAVEIAAKYWAILSSNITLYPDALRFLGRLKAEGVQNHISTGSDSSLRWAENGWVYDPKLAKKIKMFRVRVLDEFGFSPASVTTGDPIDKPDKAFYEQVMLNACIETDLTTIDPATCITVGDSFRGDVAMPMQCLGIPQGYWLQRGQPRRQLTENIHLIGSLDEIPLE